MKFVYQIGGGSGLRPGSGLIDENGIVHRRVTPIAVQPNEAGPGRLQDGHRRLLNHLDEMPVLALVAPANENVREGDGRSREIERDGRIRINNDVTSHSHSHISIHMPSQPVIQVSM